MAKQKSQMEAEQQKDMTIINAIREELETTHLIIREQHERELGKIKNEPSRILKSEEKFA